MVDEELDLQPLRQSYAGRGTRPHAPALLLKLVLYEHERGRHQPTQWREDLTDNIAARWLTFGMEPSLTSLYEFRDRLQPLLEGFNRQVIQTAIAEGRTSGTRGALDGTTVAANATRHRLVNLKTVDRRLAEAPPPTPRRRRNLLRARVILLEKHAANAKRRKDKQKPPDRIRLALGDPEAPFGLDKQKTYRPLYNAQVVRDVETDLVLAHATTATTSDAGLLPSMIERTVAATGRPLRELLADAGYTSGEDLAHCRLRGVTLYAPWNENAFTEAKRAAGKGAAQIPKDQFVFDRTTQTYRCPQDKPMKRRERSRRQRADGTEFVVEIYQASPSDCAACALKPRCLRANAKARTVRRREHEELIEEHKVWMQRPESKERYRLRCQTVERCFADLKAHRGLQRFSGRTLKRADAQVGLTILAHNLRALDKLRERRKPGETAT